LTFRVSILSEHCGWSIPVSVQTRRLRCTGLANRVDVTNDNGQIKQCSCFGA